MRLLEVLVALVANESPLVVVEGCSEYEEVLVGLRMCPISACDADDIAYYIQCDDLMNDLI